MELLEEKRWWEYINEDLRELLREALLLSERVGKWEEKFHDYSFVVFPAAKAYEGFLKTLFFDLKFITGEEYYGKRFRVGRALNPSLDPHLREAESVYDKLVSFCQGRELPDALWNTWREGRNMLFHWFPKEKNTINLSEAKDQLQNILNTMDLAFKECKIERTTDA